MTGPQAIFLVGIRFRVRVSLIASSLAWIHYSHILRHSPKISSKSPNGHLPWCPTHLRLISSSSCLSLLLFLFHTSQESTTIHSPSYPMQILDNILDSSLSSSPSAHHWQSPLNIFLFFFLAMVCNLWNLRSLSRDRTQVPSSESTES